MARLHMIACIFFFLGYLCTSWGHLDLFMNETETRRLLGIPGELYYVRNGIKNDYALGFNLPLKPDIVNIYFSWQNLRTPAEGLMMYSINVTSSNVHAMPHPVPNIDKEGLVPTKLTVFKISLPCLGEVSAEVDVRIQMNVSIFSATNLTVLNLKRRKTCLKDIHQTSDHNHRRISDKDKNVSYTYNSESADIDKIATTSTSIFYIAVGCACGLIILVALIVTIYYVKSQKTSNNEQLRYKCPSSHFSDTSSARALTHEKTFLRADTPNNSVISGKSGATSVRRGFAPVTELKPLEVRNILGEIRIERTRISLGEVLMEGTFGKLYHGTLLSEDENEMEEQDVFIKSVTDHTRRDQIEIMMREGCLLKGLCHQNINPVLASCVEIENQPFLIYPYMDEGNLKKFLLRCKISDVGTHQMLNCLNTQQLVYMAIQVTRGVQYLHRKRILHKDIATRNCVVDSQLAVRCSDNALSRDMFPNDYHCLGDNENRPIKWLAIESLLERKFSPASEVWTFGVLLWELITLGQQPYADIDPFEMAAYLREGYRVAQPINCPDELFAVMACCWAISPDERPKFSQLQVCLQDFYTALGRFI